MAWHEVTKVEALIENEPLGVDVGGHQVLICRTAGDIHAVNNVCTHQFAFLSDGYIEDGCIECPLHQGRFDLKTGAPSGGPVEEPIQVYAVKVGDGKVLVDLPD